LIAVSPLVRTQPVKAVKVFGSDPGTVTPKVTPPSTRTVPLTDPDVIDPEQLKLKAPEKLLEDWVLIVIDPGHEPLAVAPSERRRS